MTTVESVFIVVTLLYTVQSAVIVWGARRSKYIKNAHYEPSVSIVVAARNEEKGIDECLASLHRLDYPDEKLEIIIVDDNSTDSTAAKINEYVSRDSRFRFVSALAHKDHLRGKANAIAQGIDVSHGDIIMMTDADCCVPTTWVRETVRYYEEDTGVVAGLTLLKVQHWFSGMQSLDWSYILAIASSAMALGHPLSCIGNNFTFRKKAYDEVGGYRGIQFSVTEDFALFKAITGTGRWGYRYPIEKETTVISTPCSTVLELYRQKRRWGVGGKDMDLIAFCIMAVGFVMQVLTAIGSFVLIATDVFLAGIVLKILSDYLVASYAVTRTGQRSQLKYFIHFELYFIISVIVLPFAVFFGGNVIWKGRKY